MLSSDRIDDIALKRDIVTSADFSFSHTLDDWKVTNQKSTGRCWMFAGLNLLRVGAMKKMKEFEFSQNYTFFWDSNARTTSSRESSRRVIVTSTTVTSRGFSPVPSMTADSGTCSST